MTAKRSARLYAHPFCRDYWRDAAAEFKDTRVLIFAALMIALRVAPELILTEKSAVFSPSSSLAV